MTHIALPSSEQRRLVWYLAMEEYVAQHLFDLVPPSAIGGREAFFIWQVPPTVIFGRNQVMEAEVNLDYCRAHGVQFFRRKSGGGCVYADRGNIMLSYICDGTDVAFTFDRYLRRLALALCRLGLDAEKSGRNDVLVGGRKVSGNAFTLLPKCSIVHGTMLYDTDFEAMTRAITPSEAKIRSKGVASVRQHVTNVREELERIGKPLDLHAYKEHLLRSFCTAPDGSREEIVLDEAALREIDAIEATYLEPDFLAGKRHAFTLEFTGKPEGVGELTVAMDMDGDRIAGCHLAGDYFTLKGNPDELLSRYLCGCPLDRPVVAEALHGLVLQDYVMNLTSDVFMDLLFEKPRDRDFRPGAPLPGSVPAKRNE